MAPVSVAPSIRRALRQITAKEACPPVHGVFGRFWDPDSDSECEDLGDDLRPQSLTATPPSLREGAEHRLFPTSTSTKASASPLPVRPPWLNLWKGPLPPRRITPVTTIGEYIVPKLQHRLHGRDLRDNNRDQRQDLRGRRDPTLKGFQFSKQGNHRAAPDPTRSASAHNERWAGNSRTEDRTTPVQPVHDTQPLCGPKRRLVNTRLFFDAAAPVSHAAAATPVRFAAPVRSYRDALMAGNRGFHGRPLGGQGTDQRQGSDQRRGRGLGSHLAHGRDGQGHGTARGRPHHGRGTGADAADGRGRGRGVIAHGADGHGRGRGGGPRPKPPINTVARSSRGGLPGRRTRMSLLTPLRTAVLEVAMSREGLNWKSS